MYVNLFFDVDLKIKTKKRKMMYKINLVKYDLREFEPGTFRIQDKHVTTDLCRLVSDTVDK